MKRTIIIFGIMMAVECMLQAQDLRIQSSSEIRKDLTSREPPKTSCTFSAKATIPGLTLCAAVMEEDFSSLNCSAGAKLDLNQVLTVHAGSVTTSGILSSVKRPELYPGSPLASPSMPEPGLNSQLDVGYSTSPMGLTARFNPFKECRNYRLLMETGVFSTGTLFSSIYMIRQWNDGSKLWLGIGNTIFDSSGKSSSRWYMEKPWHPQTRLDSLSAFGCYSSKNTGLFVLSALSQSPAGRPVCHAKLLFNEKRGQFMVKGGLFISSDNIHVPEGNPTSHWIQVSVNPQYSFQLSGTQERIGMMLRISVPHEKKPADYEASGELQISWPDNSIQIYGNAKGTAWKVEESKFSVKYASTGALFGSTSGLSISTGSSSLILAGNTAFSFRTAVPVTAGMEAEFRHKSNSQNKLRICTTLGCNFTAGPVKFRGNLEFSASF